MSDQAQPKQSISPDDIRSFRVWERGKSFSELANLEANTGCRFVDFRIGRNTSDFTDGFLGFAVTGYCDGGARRSFALPASIEDAYDLRDWLIEILPPRSRDCKPLTLHEEQILKEMMEGGSDATP
jgi:hypothetical protein